MRVRLALTLLCACAGGGGSGGGGSRPAVIPLLSELPADPEKRNAVLDSATAQPGPEHRKRLPPKLHKAETAAATAAAILGELFSTTRNTVIGTSGLFEENDLVAPAPTRPDRPAGAPVGGPGAAPEPSVPATELVPWVRVKETTPARE